MTAVYEQFRIKLAQKLRQKPVSAKVTETLVETCFCQDGLNRFKPTGAGRNLPTLALGNLLTPVCLCHQAV